MDCFCSIFKDISIEHGPHGQHIGRNESRLNQLKMIYPRYDLW